MTTENSPQTDPPPTDQAQPQPISEKTQVAPSSDDVPVEPQAPSGAAPQAGAQQGAQVASEAPKLSAAELKKQAKAEKAARRAQVKASRDTSGPAGAAAGPGPSSAPKKNDGQKESKSGQKDLKQQNQQKQSGPAGVGAQKQMPLRRRLSHGGPVKEVKKETKQVGLFGHLYGQPRRHSIEGAAKEVHPAVLALGLQLSSYVICGSTARCVAMLLAFKKVIESYTTPPGTSLARHLTSHHLSPQIEYLKSCRPISISMGNAIRWLKDVIIKIDPSVPENIAKTHLSDSIDDFIRDRITAADALISETASSKITPGDTVLTYASSSIVRQTLLRAHAAGIPFRVIIVDSKPLFEGRRLARILAARGLDVQYAMVTAAAYAVRQASKVFLGAHAMMSNGRLYSRAGTAIVAMLAHGRDIPVIVCCESLKFTERVALDSIVVNEVAPAEELLGETERGTMASHSAAISTDEEKPKSGKEAPAANVSEEKAKMDIMNKWSDTPRLQMLNVLYDVTPAEYIKMVVTEYGSLPPSSVPVVHRMSTNS